ncbi:zf-HC2 domain-containing protein [Paenibacillus agricola]|uniref:Anti-sigma-W factor RsiW n=1 Tax=Paenibacillus agricola TaxID=2716264 RepID=A0ABX0JJT6_9BACL|nr:zf-HC2 domain-containing protein [Paenibacillus agricola]NHN35352.1 hypothetical protein [Paenibacillus agricola]
MNKLHPNERQLQRFLNRACTELENKRIKQHIHSCSDCRNRLHTYLNLEELLNKMNLLSPLPGLEERVMQVIRTESTIKRQDDHIPGAIQPSSEHRRTSSRSRIWCPELVNGLIATAATYLFISSGILGKIIAIGSGNWGAGIQTSFVELGQAVHKFSMYFIS